MAKLLGERAANSEATHEDVKLVAAVPSINDLVNTNQERQIKLGPDQYLGSSETGIGGKIVVRVTYANDKIKQVEVIENHETEGIGAVAVKKLPQEIVSANSTNVDAVSGASTATNALEAVNNAIKKAKR